jgi:hypothetical protein
MADKPVLHRRDHEHGGADPVRIVWESTGEAGTGAAIFANTGGPFSVPTTPLILDAPGGDTSQMHFYTTNPAVFDSHAGQARILAPGMYVIGCQMAVHPKTTLTSDNWVTLRLRYHSSSSGGFSIEIPFLDSDFLSGLQGHELIGTRYAYPAGAHAAWDVIMQRLHPISLTEFTTFPYEIRPEIVTLDDDAFVVSWLGLWGWRLGDPLDSWHSD